MSLRIPVSPPDRSEIWPEPERGMEILGEVTGPLVGGKYLHWDELIHREPPGDLDHKEWWFGIGFHRRIRTAVPLRDLEGERFGFMAVPPIPERLHEIDMGAGGMVAMPEQITNDDTRDQYYISSLIEEAITSSQLEGAATTRKVAKEMLRSGRKAKDKSEQMILNNFVTMRRISGIKDQPLSKDLVLEIHRLVTEKTLEDPGAAGRFRTADEPIVVGTQDGITLHDPPAAAQLDERMEQMCEFANGGSGSNDGFVHPVIRAIVLHFWLAYDHPFVDGNGRTARALFYWSMLRSGFWLFEFISISNQLLKAPAQYYRAFLYTESDSNDLTYFILHQLDVIKKAVGELHKYIARKTREVQQVERMLHGMSDLNHRQRAIIAHALRHPNGLYTVESHRLSHNVVYQTARTDLLKLAELGFLRSSKRKKTWVFQPATDLARKLEHAS